MKGRILSAILALLIAISAIPAAGAANTNLIYRINEVTTETTTEAPSDPSAQAATDSVEVPATDAEVIPAPGKADLAPTAANYPAITRISPSAKGLYLKWSAYPNAAKYMVFIRREDTGRWKKIGESTTTSFDHKNLINNTVYTYTVRAADSANRFVSTADFSGVAYRYLTIPRLTRAESANAGQKLFWNRVEGAEEYIVYVKNNDRWKVLGITDACNYLNTGVTAGRSYTYTVRCWDENIDAPLSYYDTAGYTDVYVGTPKITAFNAVENGVTVSWSAMTGASYYGVFRKTDAGWRKLATVSGTSYTHTGLQYNDSNTYTVRCMNDSRQYNSGYNTRGWSFKVTAPPEITSVRCRKMKYELTWTAQKNTPAYRVFRKEKGGRWRYLGKTASNCFTDKTASKDGVYTYTVRGIDSKDNYLTYYTDTGRYYCMGLFVIGLDGSGEPDTNPRYACEVTEDDLRNMVALVADGWSDFPDGGAYHEDVLAYYNNYVPLPIGYTMHLDDPWCAAFVSAIWIRAGVAPYIGTECGCGRFIDVAKQNNIWVENDAYVPKVGDAVIYNWSDSGSGECRTGADHIGMVTSVDGDEFTTTEGNLDGCSGCRTRYINGRFIRGFIAPNYAQIARYLSLRARYS